MTQAEILRKLVEKHGQLLADLERAETAARALRTDLKHPPIHARMRLGAV
jgi:hypothetical protein